MEKLILFLAGLFLANGIPHFIHGISGEDFHPPFLHRFMPSVPSPLFNVVWGLLFFGLSAFLMKCIKTFGFGWNGDTYALVLGFIFAAVGLSIFFHKVDGIERKTP